MPTYDYACEACGHEFEAFHAMSAPTLRTCPKCGRRRLVRRIGAGAGVIFKGSGFYQTDYKSPPRGEATKGGEGEGASGERRQAGGKDGKEGKGDKGEKAERTAGAETKTSDGASSGSKAEGGKGGRGKGKEKA